jgi:hypothetical protein
MAQRVGSDPLPGALAPALVGAFFAFGGWWEIPKLAGEARDPARTLPRALALGVTIVTAIYILTSAVFLYLVPLERVTSGETFAAQAGELLFGPRVAAPLRSSSSPCSQFAGVARVARAFTTRWRATVFFNRCRRPSATGDAGARDRDSGQPRPFSWHSNVQSDHQLLRVRDRAVCRPTGRTIPPATPLITVRYRPKPSLHADPLSGAGGALTGTARGA